MRGALPNPSIEPLVPVSATDTPRPILSVEQAAEHLNMSESTLNRLRGQGGGPRFAKLGGRVVYRRSDLDAYVEARLCASTSEYGQIAA
jgi:excisionase family DNA binding protein